MKHVQSHYAIRTAVFDTLKADATVNAAVEGWYRLLMPKAIRFPAVFVVDIMQPMSGGLGDYELETTMADPMVIRIRILTEKHDIDDADEDLGDLYIDAFDVLIASRDLGLSDFVLTGTEITTKPFPEYGYTVFGAEILLMAVAV